MEMSAERILSALELQVAEVEMLSSMYPNAEELIFDDSITLDQVKAVLSGDIDIASLESRLGFTITISCCEKGKVLKVELICQLPHEYPFIKPQIFIRAPNMSKERLKSLREDLNQEIGSQEEGGIIIGVLAEWLKERLYEEVTHIEDMENGKNTNDKKMMMQTVKDNSLTRFWIYSHHIFSKIKRKDIQDWGTELQLHGFCMPGKPGIICAEGLTSNVEDFWYRIRRMNWKRISMMEQEVVPLSDPEEAKNIYKFGPFSELILDPRGGKGREYHMDLGLFKTYLQQHDSGNIFSLFFGLDGTSTENT